MPLISTGGRTFHVQRLGNGPPVALVHGLVIGNLATWFFGVAPRLARRRSVLLYDQRGHGLSASADSGFDLATSAADLAGVLDAVDDGFAGAVDVVGHSYGGATALRFALDAPERVRRVVVLDAPLPPFDPAEVASMMDDVDTEQLQGILSLDRDRFSELAGRLAAGRGRRGARRADRARHLRGTTVSRDLLAEQPFQVDELAGLARPVLCLYGSTSPFRHRADELGAALPDARVVELEGGHLLPLTSPIEVARAVDGFLDA